MPPSTQHPYSAAEIGRWGAFSSALVTVVLLVSGCPLGGALGTGRGSPP